METLKLVFYILGSAAFLGLIIFFIALIFNKDDGIDLDQVRINYISREIERLDKKISKETECNKCPLDFAEDTKFAEKEKMYVEKIRQLEKEVLYQKRRVDDFEKRHYNEINKESKDEQKILLFMTKDEEYILDSIEQIIEKIKSNKKTK